MRPGRPAGDLVGHQHDHRRHGAGRRVGGEGGRQPLELLGRRLGLVGVAVHPHPPELRPVVVVVVDEQHGAVVGLEVAQPLEPRTRLRLHGVDRDDDLVAVDHEHHRHRVDATISVHRPEHPVARGGELLPAPVGVHLHARDAWHIARVDARARRCGRVEMETGDMRFETEVGSRGPEGHHDWAAHLQRLEVAGAAGLPRARRGHGGAARPLRLRRRRRAGRRDRGRHVGRVARHRPRVGAGGPAWLGARAPTCSAASRHGRATSAAASACASTPGASRPSRSTRSRATPLFGVLEDYPPGETEYQLFKRLDRRSSSS